MSRKLRIEQEKILQLNAEVQEELDKVKIQKERIFAPLVWKEDVLNKLNIQDLKAEQFDEVLKLVEEHYIKQDLLCRNANLADDPESITSLMKRVLFNLKFKQSIGAVDKSTKEIVGVLILKLVSKNNCGRVFSRIQVSEGEAFLKICKFYGNLSRKFNIFEHFQVDSYLDYYILCIKPEYRHQRLGYELMKCGLQVARASNIQVVVGLFPEWKTQKLAEKIGLKLLIEMSYLDWKDDEGEMIFPEPGAGNYTCAIMGGLVPPSSPPPPPKEELDDGAPPPKYTRAEKLQLLAKNKPLRTPKPEVLLKS